MPDAPAKSGLAGKQLIAQPVHRFPIPSPRALQGGPRDSGRLGLLPAFPPFTGLIAYKYPRHSPLYSYRWRRYTTSHPICIGICGQPGVASLEKPGRTSGNTMHKETEVKKFTALTLRTRLLGMIGLMALLICALGLLSVEEEHRTLLQERHDKVRNQVETAVSMVSTFEARAASGALGEADAKRLALNALTRMRYDGKEYFFVLDESMRYLAHGVNPALLGRDLHTIKEPSGLNMGELYDRTLSQGNGRGFASFIWAKPGSPTPQPKLAYLMSTPGWHWVVVTGIYMDDLNAVFYANMIRLGIVCAVALLLLGITGLLLLRSVRHQLGAEPESLMEVVRKIAENRLDQPVELANGDQHSVLAAVVSMQAQLHNLVQEIVNGSQAVSQMNAQLALGASDVARRSEQQSSAASDMAAAARQLTANVHLVASNAQQAQTLSQESQQLSTQGVAVIAQAMGEMQGIHQVVDHAAQAISTLTDKTQSIAAIMQVIKEISDQTNLLALNAAIEAARAGESGRGFAVVADEVRKLSERTGKATDEIAGMIDEIRESSTDSHQRMDEAVQRVASGLDLARQGSDSINRIENGNQRVQAVVNDISVALNEQAQACKEISQQVEAIAHTSTRNAQSSTSVSQAVQEMQNMANHQRELVTRFVL